MNVPAGALKHFLYMWLKVDNVNHLLRPLKFYFPLHFLSGIKGWEGGGGVIVNTSFTDNRNAKTLISSHWASYYLNRGIHPNRPI